MGDRIAELYLGQAGPAFTHRAVQEARSRIAWMCAQVRGDHVLDAGCSQGITALLLAREGKRVLGVDPDPAAIRFAESMRAHEEPAIRSRVEYVVGDLDHPALESRRFDTVIAGEVIEHLVEPAAFLRRVHDLLVPGGVLVLTTPFALTSHKDHHHIFFLSNVHHLLAPRFATRHLDVECKKIRYVGARRDVPAPEDNPEPEIRDDLLRRTEQAVLDLERSYYLPRLRDAKKERAAS